MAIPRADSTLAARVKKLEEDFRRIKLVPSTTQTAVAPLAVAKGAVWIDSSAGNEPKVWDGTNWVPVRDETIAVAQTTADTAQAAVDPLVPLTDIAAQTSGTTVSGATWQTTDTGRRIVIKSDPDNRIQFYSGQAGEQIPAYLNTSGVDLSLIGPIFDTITTPVGQLQLSSARSTGDIAVARLSATNGQVEIRTEDAFLTVGIDDPTTPGHDTPGIWLQGPLAKFNGVDLATVSDTQTLTNKNLSSATNTFPASLLTDTGSQTVTNKDLSSATNVLPANPQPVTVAAAASTGQIAITTTYDPGSPVVGIVFTAPKTGSVYLTVGGRIENATAANTTYLSCEVRQGNVIGSGTVMLTPDSGARSVAVGTAALTRGGGSRRFLLTGLTPGSQYNARTMHAGQIAGNATFFNRDLLIEPVL